MRKQKHMIADSHYDLFSSSTLLLAKMIPYFMQSQRCKDGESVSNDCVHNILLQMLIQILTLASQAWRMPMQLFSIWMRRLEMKRPVFLPSTMVMEVSDERCALSLIRLGVGFGADGGILLIIRLCCRQV